MSLNSVHVDSGLLPGVTEAPPRTVRADVEGLRGIAILSVVAAHAGVVGFSGGYVGVDVFLVISGFVITGQLLAELERSGRLSLPAFYARRAKRLLPMALLVLLTTAIVGLLLLNSARSQQLLTDVGWSAGYLLAWRLAYNATDYLNAAQAPSAVQHYWSLSIEEQFYLLWPLLLLLTWRCAARMRRTSAEPSTGHWAVLRMLAVLVIYSFAANVWTTAQAQPWAFFGLHTRAWELAVGALLAAGRVGLARLSVRSAAVVSWLGLAMIAVAVTAFSDELLYPGWYALLPVAGAAMVIAGGSRGGDAGAVRVLRQRWLQFCGGLSYGWYLWHWPLVILGPIAWPSLDSLHGRVLLSLAALGLAMLSYVLLEHPVRIMSWPVRHPRRSVVCALGSSVVLVVAALGAAHLQSGLTTTGQIAAASRDQSISDGPADDAVISAAVRRAIGPDASRLPAALDPTPATAATAVPQPQLEECHKDFSDTSASLPPGCVYGDTSATASVVLFGDSHALQWFPALEQLATERHLRLVALTKSSCTPFELRTYNETLRREYTECAQWRRSANTVIDSLNPDVVVMSSQVNQRDHGVYGDAAGFTSAWAAGVTTAVDRQVRAGRRVALIEDTPNPGESVPDCIAAALSDPRANTAACAYTRAGGLDPAQRRVAERQAGSAAGATVIDPTGWLCAATRCPVVVGNRLVFRDEQHLSTAYARWLAPALAARVPS